MKKLILFIMFLPSLASAQWSNAWVSGGGADTTGIHAAIVHNAIKIRGKFVTLIPPTDNQILKWDSAADSLKFETDLTGAGGSATSDSAATAHGNEDFDKLFPTSFLEFVIDTIGVRTTGSNLIILARAQGDILLQDSTVITGTLDISGDVGIGTTTPNAPLDINSVSPGTVGGFASGQLHVTHSSSTEFVNAVITGHNNFSTNTQLWYLGSISGSNNSVAFINRQLGAMHFSTNNTERIMIEQGGNVGIGDTGPDFKLDVGGNFGVDGTISMIELADANVDVLGRGQWWVDNLNPNVPMFTNDIGNDRALTWSGGAFHDGFSDFVAGEHFLQTAITVLGTIITGVWNGTSISDANVDDAITVSNYLLLSAILDTLNNYDNDIIFTQGLASYAANSVSADELNATGVETELEAVMDLQDMQGAVTDAQVPDNITITNLSGTNTGDEPNADLTTPGIIEIATGAETNTGTDATRAVSPDGLDDWTGSAQVTTLGTIVTGVWNGTDVAVPDGGSGAGTFTDGGILLGSGTGAFTALGVASNGQIPIGDGTTDPVLATITAGNRIQVTNGGGSITIAAADTGEIQLQGVIWDTTLTANGTLDFLTTGAYGIEYWEFAASTQDTLVLKCSSSPSLPKDFSSWLDVFFEYENESTGADTLILRMEGIAHDEPHPADLTIGTAPDTLVSPTGPAANDKRDSTSLTSITGTFAPKDHLHIILYRPATDAGVMRFFKLIFRYLKS